MDEPTRIIFRQISRWPLRALLTTLGFAGAVAMMVFSLQFFDAVDEIAASHFGQLQRAHIAMGFIEPKPSNVLHEVRRMPGVMLAETMRIVSADFESRHHRHRGSLQGIERGAQLTRIFDVKRGLLSLPEHGIIVSRKLAEKLKVREGDEIQLSVLEGKRPKASVQVAAVFDGYIGMFAYMNIDSLNKLMAERPVTEYISLLIDKARQDELIDRLKDTPAVSNLSLHAVALANFHETVANMLMIFVGFFTAFSFSLGFGVAYNAARISLSERARELATLRVLGFSRHDALYILFGETFLLLLPALPLGCLFGFLLTHFFVNASGFQTELIRLPIVIQPSTYGLSVLVMLLACFVCAYLIKRRVDQLDLVAVLKTRE
ncbi:FtsX-like permease family protein [Aliiglaciecola sp. CAU 1673]|uniref:ABC transporter permease n=1 Tax=Aliiglaciecola sp. CAU 1673 TaxID=3032595 RepID=UPI0023DC9018|nr:FtsX-like permease family protein [Aliiglaciecola sp. CAU 1673]MDF2179976.1 FtsX-like permease family protein [Aliiglaciecola sp. CAU 1673]